MTIGKKIGVCVGASLALSVVVGGVAWFSVSALGRRLDEAIDVTARKLEITSDLRANVFTFRLQERGMLLFSHVNSPEQVAACREAYEKGVAQAFENIREIRPLLITQDGRDIVNRIEVGINEYKAYQLEVWKLLVAGKTEEAIQLDKKTLVTTGGKIVAALGEFNERHHKINQQTAESAAGVKQTARLMVALCLLACIPIGLVVGIVVTRMSRQLQSTSEELEQTASQVAGAAGQIASSSQMVAQSASEQAASLEETSAASEEINSMAHRNTDNSQSAAVTVTRSQQSFKCASKTLNEMIVAMAEIGTSSDKISKIIKVIDEIAFQTNILALNAAVEAARAGEAGMGFAVVADEVRNLAHRCAQAASETAGLIEDSIQKSGAGKKKVDEVAASIRALAGEAEGVKTLVDEVFTGSQEQTRGIEQVSKTIHEMEKVTQTTAAGAEESASAAEELTAQAAALQGIVGQLGALVGSR